MIWTLPLKIIYSVVISCIFVAPAIVGYALHIQLTRRSFWALGVYGMVVFAFVMLQLVFATLNRCMVHYYRRKQPDPISSSEAEKHHSIEPRIASKLGLAVVGYREEPTLFAACLESIRHVQYPDPITMVVVIDGDDSQDAEMAAVFKKIFPDQPVVTLPHLLSELFTGNSTELDLVKKQIGLIDDVEKPGDATTSSSFYDRFLHRYTVMPSNTRIVCYMQPHCGKRQAMYTAFRILLAVGCEAIVSTDSDTKFDSRAVLELERALHWFPSIGAAAGDVRIWNTTDSALSFMSSLRYWMAFNIERAAQSFNRAVTCVSGPMGIYRGSILKLILDDWVTQRFLGMECTYGDDR